MTIPEELDRLETLRGVSLTSYIALGADWRALIAEVRLLREALGEEHAPGTPNSWCSSCLLLSPARKLGEPA